MYANVTNEQGTAAMERREKFSCCYMSKTRRCIPRALYLLRVGCKSAAGLETSASRVLLGAEVALIVEAFLAHAALVVFPVWRRVGRYPILR